MIKTVNLSAGKETKVEILGRYVSVENQSGSAVVCAGCVTPVNLGYDNVRKIVAGATKIISISNNSLYLKADVDCTVELCSGDSADSVFNKATSTSGGSGTGVAGADGKSAYQIAVANGFEGTEEEWLASLKGADGVDGTNGENGQSAYDEFLECIEVPVTSDMLFTKIAYNDDLSVVVEEFDISKQYKCKNLSVGADVNDIIIVDNKSVITGLLEGLINEEKTKVDIVKFSNGCSIQLRVVSETRYNLGIYSSSSLAFRAIIDDGERLYFSGTWGSITEINSDLIGCISVTSASAPSKDSFYEKLLNI